MNSPTAFWTAGMNLRLIAMLLSFAILTPECTLQSSRNYCKRWTIISFSLLQKVLRSLKFIVSNIFFTREKDFIEVCKNLAKYRSENNFVG